MSVTDKSNQILMEGHENDSLVDDNNEKNRKSKNTINFKIPGN